jgi:hypothetical protein
MKAYSTYLVRRRFAGGFWFPFSTSDKGTVNGLKDDTLGVGGVCRVIAVVGVGALDVGRTWVSPGAIDPFVIVDQPNGRAKLATTLSPSWERIGTKRASVRGARPVVSGGSDLLRPGLVASYDIESAGLGASLGAGDGRTAKKLDGLLWSFCQLGLLN